MRLPVVGPLAFRVAPPKGRREGGVCSLGLDFCDGSDEYDTSDDLTAVEVRLLIEALQPFAAPVCSANGCGRIRGDGGPVCTPTCFQVRPVRG
jgi:hypothetical protein